MIVICCGMKRAGSTVQFQMTVEIVKRLDAGKGLGFTTGSGFESILEQYKTSSDSIVIKMHDVPYNIRPFLDRELIKAIYVFRDLRDVTISFMNKGNRKFSRLLMGNDIDEIIKADQCWRSMPNMLISRYEVMVRDLSQECRRICDYLELDLAERGIREIAEKYSLESQKKRIETFDYQSQGVRTGVIKDSRDNKGAYVNPETLLHENHIFSGDTGQWEKRLTPLQNLLLDSYLYEWLISRQYPVKKDWKRSILARIFNALKPMKPIIQKLYFSIGLK